MLAVGCDILGSAIGGFSPGCGFVLFRHRVRRWTVGMGLIPSTFRTIVSYGGGTRW